MAILKSKTAPQPLLLKQAKLVLGIDSGATKTAAAVANMERVLGTGKAGPGNIHSAKAEAIIEHLQTAVKQAIAALPAHQPIQFAAVVVGMAGLDSPQDQFKCERIVKKALQPWINSKTHLDVVNDIHLVRRSGSDDPYGVALIAGTGSHCFGVHPNGDMAHAGGLEYLLSDEGSGYEMGVKVLRAAVRSSDGRCKPTKLQTAVLKYFHIASVRALEPIIYHGNGLNKTQIAKLAKLVDVCAKQGDWYAKQILSEAITALVLHVAAVVQRLNLKRVPFDLVVAGGLFEITATPFLQRFKRQVKLIAPHATILKPNRPPVWGAVRLAQDKCLQ